MLWAVTHRHLPIVPRLRALLYGGDYNPEQWPSEVWADDDRLMARARWNEATIGIFSWVSLEPEEGRHDFDWLDQIMEIQRKSGRVVGLATPSAGPPAWLSHAYPETLRTGVDRVRHRHGNRVNFCWTSPTYRKKTRAMAAVLGKRYGDHPALGFWHVSNEFGGSCYCELCHQRFRGWLKDRYGDLDSLNRAYWSAFWSHTYTSWDQIDAPGEPYGEASMIGLTLDWKRFTTDQIVDFYVNEASALRGASPAVPVTTNLMGTYEGLNPWKIAPHIDFAAWDSYPFHSRRPTDLEAWLHTGFVHDLNRSLKGKPFLLMESSPSSANWYDVMRLKRPNAHRLEGLQAIAHGSDGVQYFQWRQGRGGTEQFHGAVVAHNQSEDTRVFQDVADLGRDLEKLAGVVGALGDSHVALVYDWEVSWAIDASAGPRRRGKDYAPTLLEHYRAFWEMGVQVDVIDSQCDLTGYKLVVAPMLFMLRPGVAAKLADYVRAGGTLVTTYWSGVVDESGLAFAGGYPSPFRKLLGIRSEEIDALYDDETNTVVVAAGGLFTVGAEFAARQLCELIHLDGARALGSYGREFYAGRPALTVNAYGDGEAYFVASRNDLSFQRAFFGGLVRKLGIERVLNVDLPEGVTARRRPGDEDFLFLLNCTDSPKAVPLSGTWRDALAGAPCSSSIKLEPFGSQVLVEVQE